MPKQTKYYVLAIKENDKWIVEFGDYDRSLVMFEMVDYPARRTHKQIIVTGDTQPEIDAAIDELNN